MTSEHRKTDTNNNESNMTATSTTVNNNTTDHTDAKKMPKLEPSATQGKNFLKPDKLGLQVGKIVSFIIKGPHTSNAVSGKQVASVPVQAKDPPVEGDLSLNTTNIRVIVAHLGDDSDKWPQHRFDALVLPVTNPQTGQQTKGWSVIGDSVK